LQCFLQYIIFILTLLCLSTDWVLLIPNTEKLDSFIEVNEAKHKIKPNNQARIIWANDSIKEKTEYSIVYLHGFSASQEEGNPVHRNIAKAFGCNLFLSRLAEHGIDTAEQLECLTVDKYWESAKEAFVVGKNWVTKSY
jgi:hypothetical protein